jgi:hypothetical protein
VSANLNLRFLSDPHGFLRQLVLATGGMGAAEVAVLSRPQPHWFDLEPAGFSAALRLMSSPAQYTDQRLEAHWLPRNGALALPPARARLAVVFMPEVTGHTLLVEQLPDGWLRIHLHADAGVPRHVDMVDHARVVRRIRPADLGLTGPLGRGRAGGILLHRPADRWVFLLQAFSGSPDVQGPAGSVRDAEGFARVTALDELPLAP